MKWVKAGPEDYFIEAHTVCGGVYKGTKNLWYTYIEGPRECMEHKYSKGFKTEREAKAFILKKVADRLHKESVRYDDAEDAIFHLRVDYI